MATQGNAPTAQERADEKPHKKEVCITINGKDYEIHRGPAGVEHLKRIAHIGSHEVLEQEQHGHLHRLPDDGAVEIHGGEVFVAKPKPVAIKINTVDYEVSRGKTSVEHLRKIGHVPADEVLSEFKGGSFVDLANNAHVEICGGEVFASHRPTGGSS